MEDTNNIIELREFLDEFDHDLEELRRKHPNDFHLKTITQWWELERDRAIARHGKLAAVRKSRKFRHVKSMLKWFVAGIATILFSESALWLLAR